MTGARDRPIRRRATAAVVAASLLALALPAASEAHALLERTVPARGADLHEQPRQVAFFFDEPVETEFGAARVFDSSGAEVQTGDVLRPGGNDRAVGVALKPDLPDGTYTATYRVVSADSHPVSGGFVFAIGKPGPGGSSVAELLERGSGPGTDSAAYVVDRWVGYAATGVVAGLLLFLFAAFRPAVTAVGRPERDAAESAFADRSRLLTGVASAAGAAAALLTIPIQASTAAGVGLADGFRWELVSEVADTRFGVLAVIRAGVWIALLVLLFSIPRRSWISPSRLLAVLAVPILALLVVPGLSGHAHTQSPSLLLLPADIVHVAAMCIWLGGLVALAFVLPRSTATLPLEERPGLLAANLARFSPLALGSVTAIAITGTAQAIVEVGSFPALVETAFGRAVLVKIAIFAVLVGLGWLNRSRLLPAVRRIAESASGLGGTGRRLRASLRTEVGLIATVLVATAFLVGYPPSSEQATGPVSGSTPVGDALLEYTVEPATVGVNQVHLYLFDADDGSQLDPKEVEATASLPDRDVGPIDLDLRRAGPGHYTTGDAQLGIAGDWQIAVIVRTSRFDQDEADLTVPIG